MKKIFGVITESNGEEEKKIVRIGIRVETAGCETLCPVTGPCRSYQETQAEIGHLKRGLDDLLGRVKEVFQGDSCNGGLGLTAAMNAEEIWGILSEVADDHAFVQGFNGLEETRRREIAEYVLTKCNVFSGRASFFSSHYDAASGLLE